MEICLHANILEYNNRFTCSGRIVSCLGCLTPSRSNTIGNSISKGIVEHWVSKWPLIASEALNDQRGIIVSSFLAFSRQLPITSEDAVWTSLSVLPLISCSSLHTHSVEAHTSLLVWSISQWMSTHRLSSVWTRLCCSSFQGRHLPPTTFITHDNSVVPATRTARNLGGTLNDQLSSAANITATTSSCCFILYNNRRIHPFLTQKNTKVWIQALISLIDYFEFLWPVGRPCATAPPQLIKNQTTKVLPHFSPPSTLLLCPNPFQVPGACCYMSCIQHMVKPYGQARPRLATKRLATISVWGPQQPLNRISIVIGPVVERAPH